MLIKMCTLNQSRLKTNVLILQCRKTDPGADRRRTPRRSTRVGPSRLGARWGGMVASLQGRGGRARRSSRKNKNDGSASSCECRSKIDPHRRPREPSGPWFYWIQMTAPMPIIA